MEQILSSMMPALGEWLSGIIRKEVEKALEADRKRAKPEKNFTRDEVCELCHISKPTLWKKTKEGKIAAIKIGRKVMYQESEVRRLLEGC